MILRRIVIPGEVISKKNSQRAFGNRIVPSKAWLLYEEAIKADFKKSPCEPLDENYPLLMHFYFYRKKTSPFDYNNMSQGPQDLLVQAGVIPDDNMNYVIPVFHGKYGGWEKDAENPRLIITITDFNLVVTDSDYGG